jgi:hypothetical protein
MVPMSSRRRAVVEFPIECSLFINLKGLYSISDMTKYYIKSAAATMLAGTRRQATGLNRISILFYDKSGTAVCASTIEIPDGWTPKLFVGLLLQAWCVTNVISLFRVEDQASCDDIFQVRMLYYHRDPTELHELILSSPNYSFITGGF